MIFKETTNELVEKILLNLDTRAGSGISGLHSKVIKSTLPKKTEKDNKTYETLTIILTKLFYYCITSQRIPLEWKTAVATPIFKKGQYNDTNNNRSISVLIPIAKVLEKIHTSQITINLNINKILFNGQHGFKTGHSCETALH